MPDHIRAPVLAQINQTPFDVFSNHADPDTCPNKDRTFYEAEGNAPGLGAGLITFEILQTDNSSTLTLHGADTLHIISNHRKINYA